MIGRGAKPLPRSNRPRRNSLATSGYSVTTDCKPISSSLSQQPKGEHEMKFTVRLITVAALALPLAGCFSGGGGYTRVTGDTAMQAAQAQCKAEAAASVADSPNYALGGGVIGVITRSNKQDAIAEGCMARHGYLAAQ
jgi:hypothetical protein